MDLTRLKYSTIRDRTAQSAHPLDDGGMGVVEPGVEGMGMEIGEVLLAELDQR
jgi:hypothetical protein